MDMDAFAEDASQKEKADARAPAVREAELSEDEEDDARMDGKNGGFSQHSQGSSPGKAKRKLRIAQYQLYGSATDGTAPGDLDDFDEFAAFMGRVSPVKASQNRNLNRTGSPTLPDPADEVDVEQPDQGTTSISLAGLSLRGESQGSSSMRAKRRAAEQRHLQGLLAPIEYDDAIRDMPIVPVQPTAGGQSAQGTEEENVKDHSEASRKMTWGASKAREQANAPANKKGKGKRKWVDYEEPNEQPEAQEAGAVTKKPPATAAAAASAPPVKSSLVFTRAGRAGLADAEDSGTRHFANGFSDEEAASEADDDEWASEPDEHEYALGDGMMEATDVI